LPDVSLVNRWTSTRVTSAWVLYWIALFFVMHTPKEHLPTTRVSNIDKAVHVTGYALLALLGGVHAQRRGRSMGVGSCVVWFLVYAVYAVFDELTQPLVNRTAAVDDWLADMIGVAMGLAVVLYSSRRDGLSDDGDSS
jgi:VanZ family protein